MMDSSAILYLTSGNLVQLSDFKAFDGLGIFFLFREGPGPGPNIPGGGGGAPVQQVNNCVLHFNWLPGAGGGGGGPGADGGGGAGGGGAAATGGGAAVASKISSNLAPPPSFSAVSIASHFLCSNSFCGRG